MAAREIVQELAQALAARCGLDSNRITKVLERDAVHFCDELARWGLPAHTSVTVRGGGLGFNPTFWRALRHLSPDDALSLFENEDPRTLGRLELFVDRFLASSETPLYTLQELEDLTGAYLQHLSDNHASLSQIGLPETSFDNSLWLDVGLSPLYPIKVPLLAFKTTNGRQGRTLSYVWCAEPMRERRLRPGEPPSTMGRLGQFGPVRNSLRSNYTPVHLDGDTLTPCPYEQASTLPNLNSADITRLEQGGRSTFCDLKLVILHTIHQSIKCRDSTTLWFDCFTHIFNSLNQETALLFFESDRSYELWMSAEQKAAFEQLADKYPDKYPVRSSGGLLNLLKAIAHYDNELSVGLMHHLKSRLPMSESVLSVYRLLRYTDVSVMLDLLQDFTDLSARELEHQKIFYERVQKSLETLRVPVSVETEIMGTLRDDFVNAARSHLEVLRYTAEASGRMMWLGHDVESEGGYGRSDAGGLDSAPLPLARPNVFRKEGQYWRIEYEGKSIGVRDSHGLRYIAHLLRNPGTQIHCTELRSIAPDSPEMENAFTPVSGKRRAKGEKVLDQRARREYQGRISELQQEIEEARQFNDTGRVARAEKELSAIKKELKAATGLAGRPRVFSNAAETDRHGVQKAISRAVSAIRKENSELGRFLSSTVRTGFLCTYTSDVRWTF